MDSLIFILLLLLAFLLTVGIPSGIAYFIDRFIRKRNYNSRLRLFALTPIILLAFFIYRAFYPGEDFYEQDFKEVTGIEFPENGEFLYKTATFPDHFGDYTSTTIILVGQSFYQVLPQKLLLSGFKDETDSVYPNEFQKALSYANIEKIEQKFTFTEKGGKYFVVCFLSDKQSLLIQRISW